jgi:large subunit ribosomal protein L29
MKSREIREMTDKEIQDSLEDKREELFNFRFQLAAGQLEDLSAPRRVHKEIARMLTVLRERQLAQEKSKNG